MFRTTLFSLAIVSLSFGCAQTADCTDGTCGDRPGATTTEALRISEEGCDGLREAIDQVSDACASAIDDVILECRTAAGELEDRCDGAISDLEAELALARERLGELQDIYDRAVAAGDRETAGRAQAAIDDVGAEIRSLLADISEIERRCAAAEDDIIDRCESALDGLDERCDEAFADLREAAEECADGDSSLAGR